MIHECLKNGFENKISRSDLMTTLNLNTRQFYDILRAERRNGQLILSSKSESGYWLSDNLSELKAYYRTTLSTALDVLQTLKPIRVKIKELEEDEPKEKDVYKALTKDERSQLIKAIKTIKKSERKVLIEKLSELLNSELCTDGDSLTDSGQIIGSLQTLLILSEFKRKGLYK